MDNYLKIILSLLAVSWVLYIIMYNVLATHDVFAKSIFFSFGGKFSILGVTFENQSFYTGLGFFFFFNSLISNLNMNIISPVFSRLIFAHPDEKECHDVEYKLSKESLFVILLIYDLWLVVRSLFNLLGIISNFGFFIATSMGFLIGDISVKYIYFTNPSVFNFHQKDKFYDIEKECEKEVLIQSKPQLEIKKLFF